MTKIECDRTNWDEITLLSLKRQKKIDILLNYGTHWSFIGYVLESFVFKKHHLFNPVNPVTNNYSTVSLTNK